MKIAIIGTGLACNVAAYRLAADHDITVFEADYRVGGHSNTIDVDWAGTRWAIDTGFIVFNDHTYPNFIALLDELGVTAKPTEMSFSVSGNGGRFEYNGAGRNELFAQRLNLFRPGFHRMLRDILRFNREAPALLAADEEGLSLEAYVEQNGYSREFIDRYLVPMGSAIWSASQEKMRAMPARFFIQFFHNHGLLRLRQRPQWRVIRGGSRCYVDKLVAGHRDRIRLSTPVQWIRRHAGFVEVKAAGSEPEFFDRVFMACHSDQALALLADPSRDERRVLGAIKYQPNEAILHTDESLMPQRRLAWAAWNYQLPREPSAAVTLTYNMNILQGLRAPVPFCVTLNNREAIDPSRVIASFDYAHPQFTGETLEAQKHHRVINGEHGTYYCGAYWRHGFHEDGVVSALNALKHFEEDLSSRGERQHEQRYLRRAS